MPIATANATNGGHLSMIRAAAGSPTYCSVDAYNQFLTAVIHLDSADALLRAACAVSKHAFGDQHFSDVSGELDRLAYAAERTAGTRRTPLLLAALNDVVFDQEGFALASGEAPIFSYLPQVLSLKLGSAETLCMIYHVAADRLRLRTQAVQLRDRFCIRARDGEGFCYVDPGLGRCLSEQETRGAVAETRMPGCGIVTREGWLRRLLRNVQVALARGDHQDDLEAVIELQDLLSLAR